MLKLMSLNVLEIISKAKTKIHKIPEVFVENMEGEKSLKVVKSG